jgi:RNA polymerase sigma-70 factor (ECF subfamily)
MQQGIAQQLEADAIVESAFAAHVDAVRRGLTRHVHDPAVAEDLAQEAFIRLVIEVRAGRTPDHIGSWLHRVGYNLAMSRGRRMAVAERHAADLARSGDGVSPEVLTLESERDVGLRTALATLGGVDRQALVLAAQGYRTVEIARSIGRTDGATRTLLCRARTKLRGVILAADDGKLAA